MKSIICVLLAIVMCLSFAGCGTSDKPESSVLSSGSPNSSSTITQSEEIFNSEPDNSDNGEEVNSETVDDAIVSTPEDYPYEEGDVIDFSAWNLTLVNPWNALPENFDPDLSLISKEFAGFDGASFDSRAIDHLHAMCNAAKADGIKLTIISAYRTNDFQTYNFNRKVNRVMEANPSLTREQAEEEAAKVVARPGTSEHQLGLAIDFNSVEDSFRYTSAYAWLTQHCTEYGFILRYADDKQAETGIIPEPWHYRYVGVQVAKAIAESGLCFEEFIEQNSSNN